MAYDPTLGTVGALGYPPKTVLKSSASRTTYPHSNVNRSEKRLWRRPIVKKLLKFFPVASRFAKLPDTRDSVR
jgi:hypothetical protein